MANTIKLKRASGSDPGNSDLSVGELAIRTSNCKLFSKNDSGSAIGIVAGSADTLTTARTIAGVSFDGSANISLNNNAITNGAGYITATLTNEQVQDIVGGMLTGNTETGITVTYQDGDGTIDFVVGTLNQDTTGNAATATALETARTIGGTSFDGTANITPAECTNADTVDSLHASSFLRSDADDTTTGNLTISNSAPKLIFTDTNADSDFQLKCNAGKFEIVDTTNSAERFRVNSDGHVDVVGNLDVGAGVDVTGNITVSGTVDGRDVAADGTKLDGIASGATNVTNNNQLTNGAGYITSADGGNAATLDSIDSSQFLRSDTADSGSGLLTLSGGLALSGKVGAAITAASDGSTITLDLGANTHQSVTLGGNRTFAAPSNQTVGQSGSIFITQDGTGSRTASFNSAFKFVGGTAPTLSTAASAVDRIDYVIKSSNVIHCAISLDVK